MSYIPPGPHLHARVKLAQLQSPGMNTPVFKGMCRILYSTKIVFMNWLKYVLKKISEPLYLKLIV